MTYSLDLCFRDRSRIPTCQIPGSETLIFTEPIIFLWYLLIFNMDRNLRYVRIQNMYYILFVCFSGTRGQLVFPMEFIELFELYSNSDEFSDNEETP